MRIAIDANELCLPQSRGVKVYTGNVIRALSEIDSANEYVLYSEGQFTDAALVDSLASKSNFKQRIIPWNNPFWTYTRFPYQLWRDSADVLFMPIQTVPFLDKGIGWINKDMGAGYTNILNFTSQPSRLRIVTVVHDVAFLKFPQYFTWRDKFTLSANTKRALRFSDTIIVPSETTKNDIIQYYQTNQKKIRVVPNGYDRQAFFWRKPALSDHQILTERYKLDKRYIIFVGVIQPRKNISALVKSFKELVAKHGQDIELAIVGTRGWMSEEICKEIKNCGFFGRIRVTGEVSLEDLGILLRRAEAFVLPSLYEGFGLPVIEAMACGVPVVTSNISSLPEVGGQAAVYIDPYDPSSITDALLRILQDKDWRETLRLRGFDRIKYFSWEKTGQQIRQSLVIV